MASDHIVVDTTTLVGCVTTLETKKVVYSAAAKKFVASSFGAFGPAATIITNINNNYTKLASNIGNISEYIKNYADDVTALENAFLGTGGTISSQIAQNYANTYASKRSSFAAEDYLIFQVGKVDTSSAMPQEVATPTDNVAARLGANAAVFGMSAVEGVVGVAENLGDTVAMISTGIFSIGTGLWDLFTGDNATERMWEKTKAFVAEDLTSAAFDGFYNNTEAGQWLKTNCYYFDETRAVGKALGKTAANIALSATPLGAFGTGLVTGFGANTQKAWQNGASVTEGLMYGGAKAATTAITYYVGGKLLSNFGSGVDISKGTSEISSAIARGTGNQAVNALVRKGSSSLDNVVDSLIDPYLQSMYREGAVNAAGAYVAFAATDSLFDRWQAIFEENGGLQGMAVSVGFDQVLNTNSAKNIMNAVSDQDWDELAPVKTPKPNLTQPDPITPEKFVTDTVTKTFNGQNKKYTTDQIGGKHKEQTVNVDLSTETQVKEEIKEEQAAADAYAEMVHGIESWSA